MKIVHISTSDKGGAGIAALRLHKGLLQQNADSSFLSLFGSGTGETNSEFNINPSVQLSNLQKIKRKFGLPVTQVERNLRMLKGINGDYEIFSFPFSDFQIEQHPLIQSADIINLHWVAGLINYPSFFKFIKKPVVWTLHDMNPFMGGFHYNGDKIRNENNFKELENELIHIKQKSLINFKGLTIVSPSKWIADYANNSVIFNNYDVRVIMNSIDLSVFKPHQSQFSREQFNLPVDKKIILFVSQSVSNFRKGFDLLTEALTELQLGNDVLLVTVGEMPYTNIKNSINLGVINDDHLMSLLYAASNLFILPSREDNFPNVMLESLGCGTPIIAFNTGGMEEIILTGFNGILSESITSKDLCAAIKLGLNMNTNFDRKEIRKFAEAHFDMAKQANSYINLYKQLI